MPFTRRKGLRTKDFYENFDDLVTAITTIESDIDAAQADILELEGSESLPAGLVGTANTGVTAVEYHAGRHHVTSLTFTDLAMPDVGDGANLAIGKLLYTLPAGVQIARATYMSVGLQGGDAITTDTPDVGIGSTIASGANALLSANAAFEDYLTGQTATNIDGTATVALVATTKGVGAATAKTIHLNVADGWADMEVLTLTATGTVVIEWVTMV